MTTSVRDFEGAVAIVTGGSTGLGRSIAEEVARRGASFFIVPPAQRESTIGILR